MPAGGTLKVRLDLVPFWVRISFGDTGIGMDSKQRAKIFEPLQSSFPGGTGLGLSICRWLIQMHGGRMWVESTVGKGSAFYFALPLASTASLPQPEELIDQAA